MSRWFNSRCGMYFDLNAIPDFERKYTFQFLLTKTFYANCIFKEVISKQYFVKFINYYCLLFKLYIFQKLIRVNSCLPYETCSTDKSSQIIVLPLAASTNSL